MAALFSLAVRTSQKTSNTVAAVTIAAVVSTAAIARSGDETLALRVFGPAIWLLLGPALGAMLWTAVPGHRTVFPAR